LHNSIEEAFYVLEGLIEYEVGDKRIRAETGDIVFAPASIPHTFRNVATGSSRHLVIASSPRHVEMIEELGRADREHTADVFARYDSELAPSVTQAREDGRP
jgi:mannose-6-phosphate isomerase-like protein (cupin superfamily)